MYKKDIAFTIGVSVLLALIFVTSCSDEEKSPTGPGSGSGEGGDITITVGTGTKPQYSWQGGNVSSVSIIQAYNPSVTVWGIATAGKDNIASPVTHGTVPAGAIQTSATATTLKARATYRVTVSRTDGKIGWKLFTP